MFGPDRSGRTSRKRCGRCSRRWPKRPPKKSIRRSTCDERERDQGTGGGNRQRRPLLRRGRLPGIRWRTADPGIFRSARHRARSARHRDVGAADRDCGFCHSRHPHRLVSALLAAKCCKICKLAMRRMLRIEYVYWLCGAILAVCALLDLRARRWAMAHSGRFSRRASLAAMQSCMRPTADNVLPQQLAGIGVIVLALIAGSGKLQRPCRKRR